MKMQFTQHIGITIVICFMIMVFTAGSVFAQAEVTWVLGQSQSPEAPWSITIRNMVERINEQTGGRFIIQQHTGGVLGGEYEVFDQMVEGVIEMQLGGPGCAGRYVDEFNALHLNYFYKGPEHMQKVKAVPIIQDLFQKVLNEKGIRTLDIWYYGTRHLTANYPVYTPDDFKGLKIRSMDTPFHVANTSSLGCIATPVAFAELYMALQTGVVDGQENPLPTIYGQKFYEVQDYLILTAHKPHGGLLQVNEKAWQALPAEFKDLLIEEINIARVEAEQMIIEQEGELIDILSKEYGVKVIYPDVEAFRKHYFQTMMVEKGYGDKYGYIYEAVQGVK